VEDVKLSRILAVKVRPPEGGAAVRARTTRKRGGPPVTGGPPALHDEAVD
jgi:hypothetical protein